MRRLNPRAPRPRGRRRGGDDERGAVVVLVTLVSLTLVGVAALVIDVASLQDERGQLQNGADAAALAIAHSCAVATCDASLAPGLADGNARDGATAVDSVTYPASHRVRVATSTRTGAGSTILPYRFAQQFSGARGRTVHASATAAWGGIEKATTLALVMSACEWDVATSGGTVFNTTHTGPVSTILFHTGGGANTAADCAAQAGQDTDGDHRLPGGFGWTTGTACSATLTAGDWASESPGVSAPSGCNLAPLVGTDVLMPIFNDVNGLGGANGRYHVEGFAVFYVTGYRFPSTSGGTVPCSPPVSCIGGYFSKFLTTAQAIGGPDLGASAVLLVS